jgi:hypothetical protein
LKFRLLLTLFVALLPIQLHAVITVYYPASGLQSASPLAINASSSTCQSGTTTAMGYSFDDSTNTTIEPVAFRTFALVGNGQHTLHVKCWGTGGTADVVNIPVNIVASTESPLSTSMLVPSVQAMTGWVANHDAATGASSTGTTWVVSSPSYSGHARAFWMSFSNSGGEIYHQSFADDYNATHFIYDVQLYLTNITSVANIEMDLNQVLSNGQTVIYGFQCDGYSGTWDYTVNTGTPTAPVDTWVHSAVKCPAPSTWRQNAWHHVQIAYSRDASGNVTYQNLTLDGTEYNLNAKGNSAFALGWGPVLLVNFQLDGLGASGSANAYIDNMTIYHW